MIGPRFCKRGHDTELVGRDTNYYCKGCRRESDLRRKRREREGRPAERGKHSQRHPLEWERARIQRWSEIVAENPITAEFNGTLARKAAFGERYERLEAQIPTPDDEPVDA
jgi:hypothetical protein